MAGTFYPAHPATLAATVDGLLVGLPSSANQPAALIVPHAGYQYSGPVAARAYVTLAGAGESAPVVLIGPSHFVPLTGLAAPAAAAWRTPLGVVDVDRASAEAAELPVDDRPHAREHALEVQLPFLQRVFGAGLSILPIAVGQSSPAKVADALDRLAEIAAALIVVSTDLSHYHDDATARRRDARTAAAILARDPARIADEDACGAYALRGALAWAARHDLQVRQLDLATSADTAGGPERVVGYGAFAISRRLS